jgi:DNA-binding transcriptional MerR regulator
MKDQYMTPKEILKELGISRHVLGMYRRKGILTKIKWSIGGRKPYYEINEVKKLFHKN